MTNSSRERERWGAPRSRDEPAKSVAAGELASEVGDGERDRAAGRLRLDHVEHEHVLHLTVAVGTLHGDEARAAWLDGERACRGEGERGQAAAKAGRIDPHVG